MLDALTNRFEGILRRLRGRGRLSEADVDEVTREIRVALLEADVNLAVIKDLVRRIKDRSVGVQASPSLDPAQQVIKIVHEELAVTLGGSTGALTRASRPPAVVVLVGLQGSGKTTVAAKIARHLAQQGKRPLLVAADLQRPAAVEQLRVLGERAGVAVHVQGTDPVAVARAGRAEAERTGMDPVIVDTAGRLQVDDTMMDELAALVESVSPHDVLLVVDAMAGQDALGVAEAFAARVPLSGVVLTKLDGDARGGAALSARAVTGVPIVFAGTGEKLDDLEVFHPDRMAGRILGMGDVLTLIERAEATFEADEVAKAEEKLRAGRFTLDDFLDQMHQMRKLGPIGNVVGMLPGVPKELRDAEIDERELGRIEAIIHSMTPAERADPALINGSRRLRIARGSGTTTQQVNALLKQHRSVAQLVRSMSRPGRRGRLPGLGR